MKTDNIPSGDVIWTNNDDLLPDENCLPVIGTCQITSILSNLDSSGDKIEAPADNPSSSDVLQNGSDVKSSLQNDYVVLKDNRTVKAEPTKKPTALKNGANNFEDMLYFVCNLCPFLCTKNSKITEHLENAHKTKTVRKLPHLKCPACPNVFFHKMSLRSHLIHDHGVGNSDINLIIQAVVYYANKAKSNDTKKVKVEANFEPSANDNSDEESAKTVHLPKVEIIQTKAEKMFNSMMNQQAIMKLIGSKKLHPCAVPSCKVALQSADNMSYHIKCHKDNGFACPVCSESFMSWKQLASHLWRLHKVDMELYSCDKCSYKSVSLAKLNNIHKLIHGDVKNYVCSVCKKAFKNSKQLGNHKNTHKTEFERVRYVCDICSKSFSDKRQLRIHMNVVHEKIKPYLCSYCGYKGSSRSSLKMHIRQHTGEKPFTCEFCSYATSDHNSLRRHKLRHTGQKPYKCSYCPYACIQSSTYKVHIKTKHPGQEKDLMFTCQECQFRSVNKEMYVAHMITVHDQKPQT